VVERPSGRQQKPDQVDADLGLGQATEGRLTEWMVDLGNKHCIAQRNPTSLEERTGLEPTRTQLPMSSHDEQDRRDDAGQAGAVLEGGQLAFGLARSGHGPAEESWVGVN
jgi:hypothetical protein